MERRILRFVFITIASLCSQLFYVSAQTQLAAWTFDSTPAAPNTPTSLTANLGAQSGAAILYANGTNSSSTWTTTTAGNELTTFTGATTNDPRTTALAGSALTLANSSANGKVIVIKFSMTNFKDPILSFATRGTSTGFNTHQWAWSTEGTVFTNVGSNTAIIGSTFTSQSLDLSSINLMDGTPTVYLKLTVTGATTTIGNNRLDNIVINASIATRPNFTPAYPKAQTVTSTGFKSVVNLDKPGIVYLVVLPDGATPPASAHVKAGQDESGNLLAANLKASITVSAAGTDIISQMGGLISLTDYDAYFVAENSDGIQAVPVRVDITTLNAADTTPPNSLPSYPLVNGIGPASFTVRTNLNEPGMTYFVVLDAGTPAPGAAQVKGGKNASGIPLPGNLIGTIDVALTNTEFNMTINGLMPATTYDVYLVSEDNIPNLQPSPIKVTVTTAIVFTENFDNCSGHVSSFAQVSVIGLQFWDCTAFGNNTTNGVQINAGTSSGSTLNEDWLISPMLTLTTNATVSFDNKKDFQGADIGFKISTDYDGSSTPASASWINLSFTKSTNSGSTGTWVSSGSIDLSSFKNQNVYVAFVYTSGASANSGARWGVDNFSVVYATAHYIITSTAGMGSFGYVQSPGSSVAKSFSVKAAGLSADLTISAPANFEVSKDGNTFAGSVGFTSAESITSQSVFVRFKPAAGVGVVNSSISLVSGGISRNVAVSGTEGADPRNNSFDVVTYNLEFFGTDLKDIGGNEFGPRDDALQINNVRTVMETMAADVIAVEEVSDDNALDQLIAGLPGYDKIVSNRWSHSFDPPDPNFPPQKIGFIYKTSTVQLVGSRVMFVQLYDDIKAGTVTLPSYPGGSSSFWSSGRLPFMVTVDVTINGIKKRIRMINIHAKSGSTKADYDRRKYDVKVLYDSLNSQFTNANIILLGDFNDDVDTSILNGAASSYKTFVDDTHNFNVLTYTLSQTGASSFPNSSSFLDHIVISDEMVTSYVTNSIAIEDARNYVTNYVNTTSDHLPVIARFSLAPNIDQTITFTPPSVKMYGDTPFTLTATSSSGFTVSFTSSDPTVASITGNTVIIHKSGTVNVTASQKGDADVKAAPDIVQPFTINKANQTIAFDPIRGKTYGDSPFSLSATSSSGLPIVYTSSLTSVVTVIGSAAEIMGAGITMITASQEGDGNYNAATSVSQSLTVNNANQTIVFGALSDRTLDDGAFPLTATATSGLAVSFATASDKITITGNQVVMVKAGRANITASQVGSINFMAAPSVVQGFCINPAKPTVTISNANTETPTLTSSAATGNQWYLNGTAIAGATNTTLSVSAVGSYSVQAKSDDCVSEFSVDIAMIITGDLEFASNQLVVSPNPVENFLEVRGLKGEIEASQVFDMTGQMKSVVMEKSGETYRANVEDLSAGIYVLHIQHDAIVSKIKFIKI